MFERSVGKNPVPYIASSRTSTGGSTGRKPSRSDGVDRVAVERRARAAPCRRSCSRTARPRRRAARSMSKRPISVCSFGVGRAAAARPSGGSPPRPRRCRRRATSPRAEFGIAASSASRSVSASASSCLGALQLLLDAPQLLELLGRRLALQLRLRAQLVDPRDERAPALVGGEPGVERFGGALARKPAAELVGVGAGGARVDHERESTKASNS